GTDARHSGHIGYLSAEFTQPYATTIGEEVGGSMSSAAAPLSASIQDERLRILGVYHPGAGAAHFIAPTPTNVALAFRSLSAPSTASYNSWNVYAQTYPTGTVQGGVNYSGLSILGVPVFGNGAYPLAGVSFVDVYSCYADASGTRVPALKNWM